MNSFLRTLCTQLVNLHKAQVLAETSGWRTRYAVVERIRGGIRIWSPLRNFVFEAKPVTPSRWNVRAWKLATNVSGKGVDPDLFMLAALTVHDTRSIPSWTTKISITDNANETSMDRWLASILYNIITAEPERMHPEEWPNPYSKTQYPPHQQPWTLPKPKPFSPHAPNPPHAKPKFPNTSDQWKRKGQQNPDHNPYHKPGI
jgi:hypothetical protein